MRYLLIITIYLTVCRHAHSQILYSESGSSLIKSDPQSCLLDTLHDDQRRTLHTAVCPDGNIYLMDHDSIFQYNTKSGNFQSYAYLGLAHNSVYVGGGAACDAEGNYIFGGRGIASYNIYTGAYYELGILPSEFWLGDFFFYKGILYGFSESGLVYVDLKDIDNSYSVQPLPNQDLIGVAAATTLTVDCDSSLVVFHEWLPNSLDLVTYDIDANTTELLCPGPFYFGDMASDLDFIHSNCILVVDLDINNSSTYIGGDYGDTTVCGPLELKLADEDTDVYSQHGPIDSISVRLLDVLDGSAEYLSSTQTAMGVEVEQRSATELSLLNRSGTASFKAFEAVIKGLRYHHTSTGYTSGRRLVEFRPYSQDQKGDSSVMHLHLEPVTRYVVDKDTLLQFCGAEGEIDLDTVLDLPTGFWYMGSQVDVSQLGRQEEWYFAQDDQYCVARDTVVIEIEVLGEPSIDLGRDTSICAVSDYALYASGDYSSRMWWDGSTDSIKYVNDFGTYWIRVQNGSDCITYDSIVLSPSQASIEIEVDTSICSESTLEIEGQMYEIGDTVELHYASMQGCDSLIRIAVGAYPSVAYSLMSSPRMLTAGDTITHRVTGATLMPSAWQWEFEGVLVDSSQFELREILGASGEVIWSYVDPYGCPGTLSNSYTLQLPNRSVYMPSAFSPNDDGINDYFGPQGPGLAQMSYQLEIYNRWGGRVFVGGTALDRPYWDGTDGKDEYATDVYVWVLRLYSDEKLLSTQKGEVLMLR